MYGTMIRDAVLDLIRLFSEQGHSGMSASIVTALTEKLMRSEPLTPLAGTPDEWTVLDYSDDMYAQNKRCSHVFQRADGSAYDSRGRVFREADGWTSTRRGSRVEITFPYTPSVEYVDVPTDD